MASNPPRSFKRKALYSEGTGTAGPLAAGGSGVPGQTGWDSFNPQYAAAMRDIARQRAGMLDMQNRSTTRLNEDFSLGLENLGRNREQAVGTLQDNLASNGILRSGINLEQQGRINEGFLRDVNNTTQTRTRALEDLMVELTAANQNLFAREEQLNFQRAEADTETKLKQAAEEAQISSQNQALAQAQPVYSPDGTYRAQGAPQQPAQQPGQPIDYSSVAQRRIYG